jgi:hypothetical protein
MQSQREGEGSETKGGQRKDYHYTPPHLDTLPHSLLQLACAASLPGQPACPQRKRLRRQPGQPRWDLSRMPREAAVWDASGRPEEGPKMKTKKRRKQKMVVQWAQQAQMLHAKKEGVGLDWAMLSQ